MCGGLSFTFLARRDERWQHPSRGRFSCNIPLIPAQAGFSILRSYYSSRLTPHRSSRRKSGARIGAGNSLARRYSALYVRIMFFTYIVTNKRNGTLYTGHTDDLGQRIYEHKGRAYAGFSKKYGCDKLVWFESHETRDGAFVRERQIKEWRRTWKLELIELLNPSWLDLYGSLTEDNVYSDVRRYSATGSRLSSG